MRSLSEFSHEGNNHDPEAQLRFVETAVRWLSDRCSLSFDRMQRILRRTAHTPGPEHDVVDRGQSST